MPSFSFFDCRWFHLLLLPVQEPSTRFPCVSMSSSTSRTAAFEDSVVLCSFLILVFREGIDIMDEHGDVHGRSVAAGRQSLGQVALTRIALPMPSKFFFNVMNFSIASTDPLSLT